VKVRAAGKGVDVSANSEDRDLLVRIFVELFQTEESARTHARAEADRLGGSPPGRALRAVADHADGVLRGLEQLARIEGLATSSLGTWIGDLLSSFRKRASDQILGREKSYRATLAGLHHGVDVVRLLRSAARTAGRGRIEQFCGEWLAERCPLVAACTDQLDWFGDRPRIALEPAKVRLGEKRRTA
jgi:hypothetical protein